MKKNVRLISILLACMMFGGCAGMGDGTDTFSGDSSLSDFTTDTSSNGSTDTPTTGENSDEKPDGTPDSDTDTDTDNDTGDDTSDDTASDTGGNSSDDTPDDTPDVDPACNHKDEDDNMLCELCGGSVVVTVDFYAVNDLHGKFVDLYGQTGVGGLTTYLKQAEEKNEQTVFLSSGDMWQGTSESYFTHGMIINDWMEQLGFVSMTLGNHEFDWGEDYIAENAAQTEIPFLALNVYDRTTNLPVEYCQPSVMIERGGAKIGVIGAIGDCYSSISSDKVTDVYFKVGSELTTLVKAESEKLKAAGADCIVYSVHDGYDNYDAVLSSGYVDVVFEGHTHSGYVYTDAYGVSHLQGGGENRDITHAELSINIARNEASTVNAERITSSSYTSLAKDSLYTELSEKYATELTQAFRLLGQNDVVRSSSELLNLAARLYYETGMERWGKDYDIVLGGGFFQARSPYNLKSGEIRYSDVQSIFPFDNPLMLCKISGYYLKKQFLETTNSNYYIHCGSYGESIRGSIDSNATYYIIVDSYTAQYAPNHATEIARYDAKTFTRDLIAKYIEDGGMRLNGATIKYTSYSEIYAIGKALSPGATSAQSYYVKGVITKVESATYNGNITIKDESGATLYVYRTQDTNGNRYGDMDNPPQVGDEVVLYGVVKNYVSGGTSTIELMDAVYIQT